jgi:putative spermidine/putrescine transport system permease protein
VTTRFSIDRRLGQTARLAPALLLVGGLSLYALGDVLATSMGIGVAGRSGGASVAAYRQLFHTTGLGETVLFSLWIALISTALAVAGGLAVVWHWVQRPGRRRNFDVWLLHVNLSVPHVVWAVALLATFSQSGLVARIAATVGLISRPGSFPQIVQDRFGLGIVLHLVTKELPFVVLAVLPLTGRKLGALLHAASTLGAGRWHRFRLVFLPTVRPAVVPAALVVFAFALGSYEPGALLGVQHPRTLAVVVLDRFRESDPALRADALALSMVATGLILAIAALALLTSRRRGCRSSRPEPA